MRTASWKSQSRAISIGVSPSLFLTVAEAPCCSTTLMASIELWREAIWRAVIPRPPLLSFMSAPLCNSTRVTSGLLWVAAYLSAVQPCLPTLSTGTPASSISTTELTSPLPAAKRKRVTSASLIPMKEWRLKQNGSMFIKSRMLRT